MRFLNNKITVLDLVWSGPHQLADLATFNRGEDYGIYQIYGTHTVNGPDNLLYLGMAQDRPFSERTHEKEWIAWEAGRLDFYLGRLGALNGAPDPSDDEWNRMIRLAEATLIYYCSPPYNSSGIKDSPNMRSLLPEYSIIINHKVRHRLPLIVSNIEHAVSGNLRPFGSVQ